MNHLVARNIQYVQQTGGIAPLLTLSNFVKIVICVIGVGYLWNSFVDATLIGIVPVIPGYLLPPHFSIWTLCTFFLVEYHFWEVLVDVVTLGLCGKLIEPLWGQIEVPYKKGFNSWTGRLDLFPISDDLLLLPVQPMLGGSHYNLLFVPVYGNEGFRGPVRGANLWPGGVRGRSLRGRRTNYARPSYHQHTARNVYQQEYSPDCPYAGHNPVDLRAGGGHVSAYVRQRHFGVLGVPALLPAPQQQRSKGRSFRVISI